MPVWRCPVCEGVNTGGRVCATCGAEFARGQPLREAARTLMPSSTPPATPVPAAPPAPPPVPATPTMREIFGMPTPVEYAELDPYETEDPSSGYTFVPVPGGCLTAFVPRRGRGLW